MAIEELRNNISEGLGNEKRLEIIKSLYNARGQKYNELYEELNMRLSITDNSFNYQLNKLRENSLIEKRGKKYYLTDKGTFLAETLEKWEGNFGNIDYSGDIGLERESSFYVESTPFFEPKPVAERMSSYEFFEEVKTGTQEHKLRLIDKDIDAEITFFEGGTFEVSVKATPQKLSVFNEKDFIEVEKDDELTSFLEAVGQFIEKYIMISLEHSFEEVDIENEVEARVRRL